MYIYFLYIKMVDYINICNQILSNKSIQWYNQRVYENSTHNPYENQQNKKYLIGPISMYYFEIPNYKILLLGDVHTNLTQTNSCLCNKDKNESKIYRLIEINELLKPNSTIFNEFIKQVFLIINNGIEIAPINENYATIQAVYDYMTSEEFVNKLLIELMFDLNNYTSNCLLLAEYIYILGFKSNGPIYFYDENIENSTIYTNYLHLLVHTPVIFNILNYKNIYPNLTYKPAEIREYWDNDFVNVYISKFNKPETLYNNILFVSSYLLYIVENGPIKRYNTRFKTADVEYNYVNFINEYGMDVKTRMMIKDIDIKIYNAYMTSIFVKESTKFVSIIVELLVENIGAVFSWDIETAHTSIQSGITSIEMLKFNLYLIFLMFTKPNNSTDIKNIITFTGDAHNIFIYEFIKRYFNVKPLYYYKNDDNNTKCIPFKSSFPFLNTAGL